MRCHRILIVGPISLSNKGTASIIVSTIDSLRTTIPGSKIVIELFYPEKQRALMNIEAEDVQLVAPLIQSPLLAIAVFTMALFWYPLVRLRIAKPLPLPAFQRYRDADVVVDLSAEAFITYFDDDFRQQLIRFGAHLYPILLGVLLDKPIVFYAETIAPFGVFRPLMKWLLAHASLVTVRDPASLENLRREGVDISKVYLTADPAFLMKPNPPPYTLEKRGKGPIIGFSAARQTGRTLGMQQYEQLLQTLSETARELIQELDATVVFIPHSSGKFNKASDDVAVGLEIGEKVNNPERFVVIQEEWSPQQTKGFIAQCDVILSLRMHPVIAALSLGVPSIIIAFNDKAIGLMQRFELERYVIRIDELETYRLTRLVADCLSHRDEIQAYLKTTMDTICHLAMENARFVKRYLESR